MDPSAYLNVLSKSMTEEDRSRESDDSVLRQAAEVDELVKRAQRETEVDAKAALAELQNDAEVRQALANITRQSKKNVHPISCRIFGISVSV